MHYLRHSWFDPTSLMSRNVQWDVLSDDSETNAILIQEYKASFLSENDPLQSLQPKRRGRQRQTDTVVMRQYSENIAKTIGVFGNDHTIHALYAVKLGKSPVALVGIRVEKTDTHITTALDMIYVLKIWRKRGLALSIAEHAGRWATLGMDAWNTKNSLTTQCHATTLSHVEASLASTFLRSAVETANLHAIEPPVQSWFIDAPMENE